MDTYDMTDREEKKYKRNKFIVLAARIILFVVAIMSVANIVFMLTSDRGMGLIFAFLPSYIADMGIVLAEETDIALYAVLFVAAGAIVALLFALCGFLSIKKNKFIIVGFVVYAIECIFYFIKLNTIPFPFIVATLPHIVFLAILIAGGFAVEAINSSTLTKRKIKKAAKQREKQKKESM